MSAPDITIIGTGGLGQLLTRALSKTSFRIKSVYNRTGDKAENLATHLGIPKSGTFPKDINELGDLVFITVSDQAIKEVAERLQTLGDDFGNRIIAHCSGNESADLLELLQLKGALTASFHPLQTFTEQSSPSDFKGIYFSLQGDNEAFPTLRNVARELGAQSIELTDGQKSQLHAAAVFASNYLVTLLDAAFDISSSEGLPREVARKTLMPLVRTTLQNIERQEVGDALSGPIKRGDMQTVEQHLQLLKGHDDLHQLYRMMGKKTVELARRSQKIDDATARKILDLLE
ncbi:MAG: Rossmann-like and DUF2520 domain-containing protein [Bacteroidota bacterium]